MEHSQRTHCKMHGFFSSPLRSRWRWRWLPRDPGLAWRFADHRWLPRRALGHKVPTGSCPSRVSLRRSGGPAGHTRRTVSRREERLAHSWRKSHTRTLKEQLGMRMRRESPASLHSTSNLRGGSGEPSEAEQPESTKSAGVATSAGPPAPTALLGGYDLRSCHLRRWHDHGHIMQQA